jgi:hypothetical protein
MALQVEGVVGGGMDTEEALRGSGRLEPLHLTFSPSHGLMRVFGTVVHPLANPSSMTGNSLQNPKKKTEAARRVSLAGCGCSALFK